jgi:hypothetical protein
MPTAARGNVTAHVTEVVQDEYYITALILSEAQVLELASLLLVALREKQPHPNGYRLAIWKEQAVEKCQGNPPCEGGQATINLVRPKKSARGASAHAPVA